MKVNRVIATLFKKEKERIFFNPLIAWTFIWNNTNGIKEKDTIKRYSSSRFIKSAIKDEKNNSIYVKIIAAIVTIVIDLKKSLLIKWEAPLCTYLEINRTKAVSMPNLEITLKISTINKAVTYWPNTKAPNLLVMKIARTYPTSKPTIFKIKVLDAPLISSIKWTSSEYLDRYDFILFKNSNSLHRIVCHVK